MKIYVDANAAFDGNGSQERPFKLINEAAKIAEPGDEVLVFPGTYRENVNPIHAGKKDARITYRSVEPLQAVITGAEQVNNWKKYQGNVWVTRVNNSIFGSYNPYTTFVVGDWYFGPVDKHTGAVYMNGIHFYETTTLDDCIKGEVYTRSWAPPAAFQDGMIGPHWAKGWIIEDCDISLSRCAGISLGKYKDPNNDHYFTYKHVKSPTQMEREAVCRGQYDGWLKEKIGHHIIRRCNIHDCEQDGIVGRQGGVFSVIEDNHVHHINNMQELAGAEIAGIKMHAAIDVIYRRNHIDHCTMGLWCDWEAQGTRITQNLFDHNYAPAGTAHRLEGAMESQDIWVEVSHGPTLIDNNLLLSKDSLKIPTQGLGVVNNLILGSFTYVGTGTDYPGKGVSRQRYTPYHIPHRTEVAGFSTILHGDDRFYNNVFVQKWAPEKNPEDNEEVGTFVFDDYPTYDEWFAPFEKLAGRAAKEDDMANLQPYHMGHLPVWVSGNVYLNGAKAWKKETNNLVVPDKKVTVELIDHNGKPALQTNLYDVIGNFKNNIINSDVLGKAFEPEQRFETPDGDSIQISED